MKKSYKKEHVLNWYFGNFCAKCEKVELESEDFGRKCFQKMEEIIENIEANEVTHQQFVSILRNSNFCHPNTREFCECKMCKRLGISNGYWIKDWKGWNLTNESPKIKTWDEATKPFRDATKKSGFIKENLKIKQ